MKFNPENQLIKLNDWDQIILSKKKFFFFKNFEGVEFLKSKELKFKFFKLNKKKKKFFLKENFSNATSLFKKVKTLDDLNLKKFLPFNEKKNLKKKLFLLNHNIFSALTNLPFKKNFLKKISFIESIKTFQPDSSSRIFFNYNAHIDLFSTFKNNLIKYNEYSKEKQNNSFINLTLNNDNILIKGWYSLNINKKTFLTKSLLNIKYIRSLNDFLINDFLLFFCFYFVTPLSTTSNLEKNHINMFFKIKRTIHLLRITFMQYFNLNFEKHKNMNIFFFFLKSFSTLNYVWFLEYNVLIFLMKIKTSNSLIFSSFLIKNNFIFSNKILFFTKFSYITTNCYIQCIISEWSFFKLLGFIHTLSNFIKKITFFKNKILNFKDSKNKTLLNYYSLKFLFFKYLETDYKTLTFIPLPISNYKLYYNYIMLTWFNYWNHKIITWKFLS